MAVWFQAQFSDVTGLLDN